MGNKLLIRISTTLPDNSIGKYLWHVTTVPTVFPVPVEASSGGDFLIELLSGRVVIWHSCFTEEM